MIFLEPRVLNAKEVGTDVEGAVYVGRPSPFGNPFRIGVDGDTKEDVIRLFREHVLSSPELLNRVRTELRGKDLICWCFPKACHAHVLIDIANED